MCSVRPDDVGACGNPLPGIKSISGRDGRLFNLGKIANLARVEISYSELLRLGAIIVIVLNNQLHGGSGYNIVITKDTMNIQTRGLYAFQQCPSQLFLYPKIFLLRGTKLYFSTRKYKQQRKQDNNSNLVQRSKIGKSFDNRKSHRYP
jgi:hypothetical protein